MLTYPQFDPVAIAIGPVSIHWYGIMYIIAFGGAWALASYRARKLADQWTAEQISDLVFYGALGAVLGPMLGSGEPALVLGFLCLALFAMGWIFGPMGALLPELFPTRVRYTGASVTYNLAGILGASGAPFAAQWLAGSGGIGLVGLYLAAAAGISFAAIVGMPETGRDA